MAIVDQDLLDRRARALELRLAGATFDAIAQACGYASRSGATRHPTGVPLPEQ